MTTKSAFSALDAPTSPALVHWRPCVEELVLPKSLKSGNFTVAKAVIRWMSVKSIYLEKNLCTRWREVLSTRPDMASSLAEGFRAPQADVAAHAPAAPSRLTPEPNARPLDGGIRRDPVDLRDLAYRPSLQLLPRRFLCAALDPAVNLRGATKLEVRDQHQERTCIGEALAAVVDIQRAEAAMTGANDKRATANPFQRVSAGMLYVMALAAQQGEALDTTAGNAERGDIFSLRAGLKGFYNSGVCMEDAWRGLKHREAFDAADVAIMKQARNITLGAYYRVRPTVNDYHAAMVEAGALYASANIHDGWNTPENGVIVRKDGADSTEPAGHAFAVVGYTEEGFLVLNSWGGGWGRYKYENTSGKKSELPGVALWTYADWASSVLDAWVLRLAVPTPGAFQYAIGEQGLAAFAAGIGASPEAGKARQLDMIGRYIHLDDGHHVDHGAFPSSVKSFRTTLGYLKKDAADKYDDIVVVLHGDMTDTSAVLSRIARQIGADRQARIFRISIVWTNDLLFGAAKGFEPLLASAVQQTNGPGKDCDALIEKLTRPIGRALWRDVKRSAKLATWGDEKKQSGRGDAAFAFFGLVSLCQKKGKRLHIITEGVGMMLLSALLARCRDINKSALTIVLQTVSLMAPIVTRKDYDQAIKPFLKQQRDALCDVTLYRPSRELERRLRIGPYSNSWTSLITKAFEEENTPLLCTADFPAHGDMEFEVFDIEPPDNGVEPLDLVDVLGNRMVTRHIFERILNSRANQRSQNNS